ncbi:MAG: PTS sugar transporter subunit IIA [Nitrospirota bacterium]|jgi:mannitol/fructose-specific phosphotransferase system IIA component (Ntr-type)
MALIIADHLGEERILLDLQGDSKVAVLRELCHACFASDSGPSFEQALDAMLEREALGSTGIGHGVAIPHAKVADLDDLRIALGLSRKGVPFDANDDQPVRLLFMIAAPLHAESRYHLQVLARLARMVRAPRFETELVSLDSPSDIQRFIRDLELEMFENPPR